MRAVFGLQLIALIIATVLSALGAGSNASTCYFVNGDLAPKHVPCFPDKVSAGDVSSCCWISNGDVCLDTGICLSVGGMAFQGACTDPDWLSNSCPHRCPDPQDNWQGGSARPQAWNVMMCSWDVYCCREPGHANPNCCNNTAVLSTTTSALGLPTIAAAITATMTVTVGVSSGSTGIPITSAVGTAAAASNTRCASATDARLCPGTPNIVAVGAGIGVSLGTLLIASLVALVILMRRQKSLRSELVRAQERNQERSMQMPQMGELPAHSIVELDAPKG